MTGTDSVVLASSIILGSGYMFEGVFRVWFNLYDMV